MSESELYPNVQALAQGCVSGRLSEWPELRHEAERLLKHCQILGAENDRLKAKNDRLKAKVGELRERLGQALRCTGLHLPG